jgi:3-deoxy-7-phosphoheptulonate synthase
MTGTEDVWTTSHQPLLPPAAMLEELPVSAEAAAMVARTRAEVSAVPDGAGGRLLVIAGPCSVHDPVAALDYAGRLAEGGLGQHLLIVMRTYSEKPRTPHTCPARSGPYDRS